MLFNRLMTHNSFDLFYAEGKVFEDVMSVGENRVNERLAGNFCLH